MDSRTDPMAPNLVGDDSVEGEIAGEQEPLKMHEAGGVPPPGSLDYTSPASPTEDPRSDPELDRDPGQLGDSRDPDAARSAERDDTPGDRDGDTPYDAEGTMGSEGASGG